MVEDGALKKPYTKQPLRGINKNLWKFTTTGKKKILIVVNLFKLLILLMNLFFIFKKIM